MHSKQRREFRGRVVPLNHSDSAGPPTPPCPHQSRRAHALCTKPNAVRLGAAPAAARIEGGALRRPLAEVPLVVYCHRRMSTDYLRRSLPKTSQLYGDVIAALRELGGSGTNEEITQFVVDRRGISEEQQLITRKDGRVSQISQSISEAKSHLRKLGYVDLSERGVWSLTDAGERITEDDLSDVSTRYWAIVRAERAQREVEEHPSDGHDDGSEQDEDSPELTWEDALIERLQELEPSQFERLALRLLREAGFTDVRVTGQSGDQGIDGIGVYRVNDLLGFHVYWQSKRWGRTVGAPEVRDFRGAMQGRGDKGLLITTSTFTQAAQVEATRDGAPPIDLVDGYRLAKMLKTYRLGISVTERVVEDVHVVGEFFAGL